MENFIIGVEKNESGIYCAMFLNGTSVELDSNSYADALLEADTLDETEYA